MKLFNLYKFKANNGEFTPTFLPIFVIDKLIYMVEVSDFLEFGSDLKYFQKLFTKTKYFDLYANLNHLFAIDENLFDAKFQNWQLKIIREDFEDACIAELLKKISDRLSLLREREIIIHLKSRDYNSL